MLIIVSWDGYENGGEFEYFGPFDSADAAIEFAKAQGLKSYEVSQVKNPASL